MCDDVMLPDCNFIKMRIVLKKKIVFYHFFQYESYFFFIYITDVSDLKKKPWEVIEDPEKLFCAY